MSEKLQAKLIIEMMGRPAEHLSQMLNELIDKLSGEKGVKVLNKVIHEPLEIKDSKDIFSSFAEVEVEFSSVEDYFAIILSYMPSNVEVFSPEKFKMDLSEFNFISNFLMERVHNYDLTAKQIMTERDMLLNHIAKLTEKDKK